jgi:glutathione S-transferase
MMRLFQFEYSPYAAKVRIALKLKGLSYEVVEVPYARRAELVALTGAMQIPVLEDGAQVISDSARIIEHLETKAGPKLRSNPLSVVLEQWTDELFEETAFRYACPGLEDRMGREQGEEARVLFRLIKERRYGAGAVSQWRADEAKYLAQTNAMLAPLLEVLQRQKFLFGELPSAADAALCGQLVMLEVSRPGFVATHAPGLSAWFDGLRC